MGGMLAKELITFETHLHTEAMRSFWSLILVGLFQGALQSKVQLTFFSLDYHFRRQIDPLLCGGIVTNIYGCVIALMEAHDVKSMASGFTGSASILGKSYKE